MAAHDVFDHFKLCGELRNAIYEQLLVTEPYDRVLIGGILNGLRIQGDRVICPKLLRLSHRFGAEYQVSCIISECMKLYNVDPV